MLLFNERFNYLFIFLMADVAGLLKFVLIFHINSFELKFYYSLNVNYLNITTKKWITN